jgi:prophage maintenance system killer protein
LDYDIHQAARAVFHAALDEGAITLSPEIDVPAILDELANAWIGKPIKCMTPMLSILLPHLKALKYLLNEETLTVNGICEIHRIMMEPILSDAGKWRTINAHAGLRTFANPTTIEEAMHKALNSNTVDEDPYLTSVKLFYEIVHCIHPFTDGNGRIGRMLMAWVLLKQGVVSFPTPIHNGHRKSRQHYESAIRNFSRLNEPYKTMRLYLIECVHQSWINWVQNG